MADRPQHRPLDDRGRACDVAELSRRELRQRVTGGGKGGAGSRAGRAEARLTLWGEAAFVLVGGGFGVMAWDKLIVPTIGRTPPGAVDILGQFGCLLAGGFLFWLIALPSLRRARWKQIRGLYLGEGRCPACGYGLGDAKRDADGCVVCSECGAAWRMEGGDRDAA